MPTVRWRQRPLDVHRTKVTFWQCARQTSHNCLPVASRILRDYSGSSSCEPLELVGTRRLPVVQRSMSPAREESDRAFHFTLEADDPILALRITSPHAGDRGHTRKLVVAVLSAMQVGRYLSPQTNPARNVQWTHLARCYLPGTQERIQPV